MKKETFFRTAVIALLSASVFVACKDDKSDDNGKVSAADNAVDLGLKSGTKWAKMNVGATNPWDQGSLFAWGETTPKETYKWSTYLHLNKDLAVENEEWKQINKYQINDGYAGIWNANAKFVGDGKKVLEPEDDAASVKWGGDWATPAFDDFKELFLNCEVEEFSNYNGTGVRGVLFTGNGKSIFMPSAGAIFGTFLNEGGFIYWTNELLSTDAACRIWGTYFNENTKAEDLGGLGRSQCGANVRPICKAGGNTNGHEAVDLGLPSGKLWGTMNVGAEKAEAFGGYVAWGETEPKETFSDTTYKHMTKTEKGGYSFNKYQIEDNNLYGIWYTKDFVGDGKKTLEDVDDAAVANWGGKWRMPTVEQIQELVDGCYWLWTDNYCDTTNVNGFIVYKAKSDTDKGKYVYSVDTPLEGYTLTDNHIFLPYSNKDSESHFGYVHYWSNSHSTTIYGDVLQPTSFSIYVSSINRYMGNAVRPVCK